MRANDYRGDPLAHNNSEFQIAARFDLLDPASTNETASCGGAFDAKVNAPTLIAFASAYQRCHLTLTPLQVTSLSLHPNRSALIVSGPTSGAVPVFSCNPTRPLLPPRS